MGALDEVTQGMLKAGAKTRDTAHAALGGRNGSGLEHKIVTATGTQTVEVKAPAGYIVTGGGWDAPSMNESDSVKKNCPHPDGTGWTVHIDTQYKFTAYAVCVRDDG